MNKFFFKTVLYKAAIIIGSSLYFFSGLNAQSDLGSFFINDSWAANQINPSIADSSKIQISLPILQYGFYHSPEVNIKDIIFESENRNIISLDNVLDDLDPLNTFESNLDLQTIGIGVKFGALGLNISHRIRFNSSLTYPEELARLIFDGNSQYIGETVRFEPLLALNSFHEFGLGANYDLTKKLKAGIKLKFLSGVGAIQSPRGKASLFTSDDIYQLRFDVDYTFQSASFVDISGVSDFNFDINAITFDNLAFENAGLGIDLGLSYKVSEKIFLAASIVDLGKINWENNANEFRSNGQYDYTGTDLSGFFADENIDFDVKIDTLEEIFAFQKTENISFETKLNSSFYIGGQYFVNDKIVLGLLYRNTFGNDLNRSAIAVNGQYSLTKNIILGLNYSYQNERNSNFGIMGSFKIGPFQLYGSTDTLLGLIGNSNELTGRIGMALSF